MKRERIGASAERRSAAPPASLRAQIWALGPTLLLLYAATSLVLMGGLGLAFWSGLPVSDLLRDPAAVTGAHPLVGLFSNIGVLLWAATAAICFFCAALRRTGLVRRRCALFLLASGGITLVLLVDDFFLVHEQVAAWSEPFEAALFAAYALVLLVHIAAFRRIVFETDYLLVFLAMSFFVASALIDVLPGWHLSFVLEDAFKLLGIVSWLAYFARTGFQEIKAGSQKDAAPKDRTLPKVRAAQPAAEPSTPPLSRVP